MLLILASVFRSGSRCIRPGSLQHLLGETEQVICFVGDVNEWNTSVRAGWILDVQFRLVPHDTITEQPNLFNELSWSEEEYKRVDSAVEVDQHLGNGPIVEPELGQSSDTVHLEKHEDVTRHVTHSERQHDNKCGARSSEQWAALPNIPCSFFDGQLMETDNIGKGGEGEDCVTNHKGGNEEEVNVFEEGWVSEDIPHAVQEDRVVDVDSTVDVGDQCDQHTDYPCYQLQGIVAIVNLGTFYIPSFQIWRSKVNNCFSFCQKIFNLPRPY